MKKILVLALSGLTLAANAQNLIGKSAPSFNMTELGGTKLSNSSLRGKVVLLDFWANWCVPCKKASPNMDKLYATYKSKGLVVVGVNVWEGKATGKAMSDAQLKKSTQSYRDEHHYSYLFTYGNGNDAIAKSLKFEAIPQFILINKSGNVIWRGTGIGNLGELPKVIEAALK